MEFQVPELSTHYQVLYGFQIAWGQISFILGVLGNMFVLYAATVHEAIKLDKMSIWIIINLAIADVGNCVMFILPILIIQYGKLDGVLVFGNGNTFYYVLGSYMHSFFVANIVLINTLSFNKLLRCVYPLRTLNTTKCQRIKVTVVTIIVSAMPVVRNIHGFLSGQMYLEQFWQRDRYFGVRDILDPKFDSSTVLGKHENVLYYLTVFVLLVIPSLTLITFNSALVLYAMKKSNTAINKMNFLVVLVVTTGFLISFIPQLVSMTYRSASPLYREIACSLTFLSCWTNPFVYLAVNPSFRDFTKNFLRRRPSCATQWGPSDNNTYCVRQCRVSGVTETET